MLPSCPLRILTRHTISHQLRQDYRDINIKFHVLEKSRWDPGAFYNIAQEKHG